MSEVPAYKNPNLPVNARVDDLIARMTLEEKIGQMTQLDWREGHRSLGRESEHWECF